MGTAGSIASILGAMLLGGMGKGMLGGGQAEDETKKLPSDPQVLKMKQKNVEDAEPIDVQAMMKKYAPGAPMTNDNMNRVAASAPSASQAFDPRAARDGGDDYRYDGGMSNEALMGEAPSAQAPAPKSIAEEFAEQGMMPSKPTPSVPNTTFSDGDTQIASMRSDAPQIDDSRFGDRSNPIKDILAKLMGTTPQDQASLDKRRGPGNRADIRKAGGFKRPDRGAM